MRTVVVFLRDASSSVVQDYLARTYPIVRGSTRILEIAGDPALYIDLRSPLIEPEAYKSLVKCEGADAVANLFGKPPTAVVTADVSGRHAADEEVRAFVYGLLGRFDGVAADDYTDHCWTVEEIKSGFRVQGHTFFDYRGWYEEDPGSEA